MSTLVVERTLDVSVLYRVGFILIFLWTLIKLQTSIILSMMVIKSEVVLTELLDVVYNNRKAYRSNLISFRISG